MNLWRLELLRLTRTHRWMILFGIYVFFAVVGPLTAAYFNEIMASFGGDVTIVAPDPRPVDGIGQYVGNTSQLGLLAVVIVAAGALAVDARPEIAAFLRTRIERTGTMLAPRYVVVTLTAIAALVVGTLVAWALTAALIGSLPAAPMLAGTLLGAAFMPFAVALLAAVAGYTRTQTGAVFASLVILLALPIIGLVPALEVWLPTRLLVAVVAMVEGTPATEYLRALGVTAVATAGLLAVALHRLGTRE